MKTLIVYGTKYGFAEKCVNILKEKLQGEVVAVNAKKGNIPDIISFDNVIIGGSIYAGQIQKGIKNFCAGKTDELISKRVGLFICGMNDKDVDKQFNNLFPEVMLANAVAKEHFGGEVVFKKMNFLERFIMKKIGKTNENVSKMSEENIERLAKVMNKA